MCGARVCVCGGMCVCVCIGGCMCVGGVHAVYVLCVGGVCRGSVHAVCVCVWEGGRACLWECVHTECCV